MKTSRPRCHIIEIYASTFAALTPLLTSKLFEFQCRNSLYTYNVLYVLSCFRSFASTIYFTIIWLLILTFDLENLFSNSCYYMITCFDLWPWNPVNLFSNSCPLYTYDVLYVLSCFRSFASTIYFTITWLLVLTFDPENLFSNSSRSHSEYLCQVSLKSLYTVQRYCITQNSLGVNRRMDTGRTDNRTTPEI